MKSSKQIQEARKILRERVLEPGLSKEQLALLVGMLNAMVWVMDGKDSTTMKRVLDSEPFFKQSQP